MVVVRRRLDIVIIILHRGLPYHTLLYHTESVVQTISLFHFARSNDNCDTTYIIIMAERSSKDLPLPLEALQKALADNQSLQSQILLEIKAIGQKKTKNRKRAAQLSLVHASSSSPGNDGRTTTPLAGPIASCPWQDSYFVNKKSKKSKNLPQPNQDEVRRREAEARSFFSSRNPVWTVAENRRLKAFKEEKEKEGEGKDGSEKEERISYEKIASALSTKKIKRTPEECRFQVRSLQQKHRPWTDDDVKQLRQLIDERRAHDPNAQIDWQECANKIGPDRTAWETFLTYQGKIAKPKWGAWTPEEDEFLLKFVAAMGPQFVLNGANVAFLVARFLPNKTKNQLFARLNHLLLNPKLVNEAWAEGDERKLALCMKVYSEAESKKQCLYQAGSHLPWRAPSSISDKWERSLNPAFSVEPFSKKEDQDLMTVMRANPGMGWKEISVKYFPRRHPHRILNRWSEIARDEDILDRYGAELLKQGKDSADDGAEDLVDSAEYVVKIKRAR
eukprot:scaffold3782_cov170-Amphora_coffeaeformis.AAC.10